MSGNNVVASGGVGGGSGSKDQLQPDDPGMPKKSKFQRKRQD